MGRYKVSFVAILPTYCEAENIDDLILFFLRPKELRFKVAPFSDDKLGTESSSRH